MAASMALRSDAYTRSISGGVEVGPGSLEFIPGETSGAGPLSGPGEAMRCLMRARTTSFRASGLASPRSGRLPGGCPQHGLVSGARLAPGRARNFWAAPPGVLRCLTYHATGEKCQTVGKGAKSACQCGERDHQMGSPDLHLGKRAKSACQCGERGHQMGSPDLHLGILVSGRGVPAQGT